MKDAKNQIPRELIMAIVRIQAAENLDFDEACKRGAILIDRNRPKSKHDEELRAQAIYKSRFMTELNKARNTIRDDAWNDGANWVRQNENNFHTPCSTCGKLTSLSNRDNNWESKIKQVLYEAFKD